jgi:Fe2+ or Zn2+ uptake regulation protein
MPIGISKKYTELRLKEKILNIINCPMKTSDIFNKFEKEYQKIDYNTIKRFLDYLEKEGKIKKQVFGDKYKTIIWFKDG